MIPLAFRFRPYASALALSGALLLAPPGLAQQVTLPATTMQPALPAAAAPNPSPAASAAPKAQDTAPFEQHADAELERHERAMADLLDEARALGFTGLLESATLDGIWHGAMAFDGSTAVFRDALAALDTASFEDRAIGLWLTVALDVREGDFRAADKGLDALEDWLGNAPDADADFIEQNWEPVVRFERASLADKRGQEKTARERYRKLADDLAEWGTFPDLAQLLRLRLAMMDVKKGDNPGQALAELAREGDDDAQRRAAVVLGLRQQPAAALDLYPRTFDDATDTARFRHYARLAEWALAAGDSLRAQSLAWDASQAARLRRDRNYALALLMEAHRIDDTLGLLIDRVKDFDAREREAGRAIEDELLDLWIELLRETERIDEAIALFEERGGEMDQAKRSHLVQLYSEGGRHADMLRALEREIANDPTNLAWRELLSRDYLERGDRAAAEAVWRPFVDAGGVGFGEESLLVGFNMLSEQGLDDLAVEVAERALREDKDPLAACILLFGLHQQRGDLDAAEQALERMEVRAAAGAPERLDLAEAWERIGRLDRAIDVLEGVVAARGRAESGEDLAMHLAWLYSEVGDEEQALEEWRELWVRVNSVARRRYVEDRMMTVAARLGSLADIAIDLETKLIDGVANEREAGLLVRLYTMVQDAVSATEVLEEFLAQKRKRQDLSDDQARREAIDALQEKGQVYLACLDYFHFEETVREIIELDPEGEAEYLQQLAMSQLERGRPDEAQESLARLRNVQGGASQAAEFQAGVLALAGMRDEALLAYRAGIAQNPDRIESWLLLGNLMKDNGELGQAIAMFQTLAETAEEDDLFIIAIDGLLNLEAGERVLSWARRLTLERLAGRSDKPYLYQLSAELADDLNDPDGVLVALESSLSISGERRSSVLRELIERTAGAGSGVKDEDKNLAYSRRLLGLGEFVPPEVYLGLGEAFLEADDPAGAARTFRKATDVPDRASFERQTAELFEKNDYPQEALAVYERALSGAPTDAGLLNKVGELHERLGNDGLANELYTRVIDLLLARLPLVSTQADARATSGSRLFWQTRNVDDFDRYFPRAKSGWLATLPADAAQAQVAAGLAALRADVTSAQALGDDAPTQLANAPRILHRARFVRDIALIAGHPEWIRAFDQWLLAEGFPQDEELLVTLLQTYLECGFLDAARALVQATDLAPQRASAVHVMVGMLDTETLPQRLEIPETRALILPLIIEARDEDVALLLARTNIAGVSADETASMGLLLNAAMFIGNEDLTLRLGRDWIRLILNSNGSEWELRPVIERMESVLAPNDFRGLCRYLAEKAMEDPDKGQAVMSYLPTLEQKLGIELFDTDQLFELLDARQDLGYGYGVDSLVKLFPAELRPTVLRSVLPRILPTARTRFCLQYLRNEREEISVELADILAAVVEESLGDAPDYTDYDFRNLTALQSNRELGLRMIRIKLQGAEDDVTMRSVEIQLLADAGQEAAALAKARALWPHISELNAESDWQIQDAIRRVRALLIGKDVDWLLTFTREREGLPLVERADELSAILVEADRRSDAQAVAQEALAALKPDQVEERIKLLQVANRTLDRAAAPLAYVENKAAILHLQLQLAEGDYADDAVQGSLKSLASTWRAYLQPSRALEYARHIEREPKDEASKRSNGLPAAYASLQLPAGSMIVINGQIYTVGAETADRPTIERVKELAEAGEDAAAQLMLRRLWRDFKPGVTTNDRYGFMGARAGATPAWSWPTATAEEDSDEAVIASGEPEQLPYGLQAYAEPEQREDEPQANAFEQIAAFAWGRAELERLLATRAPDQLDSDNSRALITALLATRVGDAPAAERDALLARFDAGNAGKLEHIEFLSLLDEHPDLMTPAAQAALETLGRTLRTGDHGPLRALARLYAERGDIAEATRLYRWLATQVAAIGAWYGDEVARIPARGLFDEIKLSLAEHPAAQVQVTQDIITFATAGSDPWSRDQQDRFAIEVWTDLLEPTAALARLEDQLAELTTDDFSSGIKRSLAMDAVPLYLHAGRYARALECLEIGLCVFDVALPNDAIYYGGTPSYPGALSSQALAELLPAEPFDRDVLAGWYPPLANALFEWHQAGRIRAHTFAQAFSLAVWRHHQLTGEVLPVLDDAIAATLATPADREGAKFTYNRLSAKNSSEHPDPLSSNEQAFLIDAARFAGREALALELEAALAERGSLSIARLSAYLEEVLKGQGPAAALELAESKLELYHAQAIIDVARRAAEALGQTERAAELADLAAQEAAAWVELDALENPE